MTPHSLHVVPRDSADPADSSPGPAKLRVLIVDDNRDYSNAAAALLSGWGYPVREAHNGREALALAADFRPRVVLLDLGLPDMHGYELGKQLRKQAGARKLHLIVVTGWMQIADQLSSSAAGVAHHLVKPVRFEIVREILAAYQAAEESLPAGAV